MVSPRNALSNTLSRKPGAIQFTAPWKGGLFKEVTASGEEKLPPLRFSAHSARSNWKSALLEDLIELAVIYRTRDGRINMPDIFRVGFGVKRKGGVKPVR